MPRVNTRDWLNLPVDKWNVTTFRAYMAHLHQEKFGIPYVTNNYAVEGRFIKDTFEKYGKEATKRFIERCFDMYKPTPQYPGINYGIMYSYMRQRILPQVLKELAAEKLRKQRQQQAQTQEIDKDWF